jgi:hypothetical protein
MAPRGLRPRGVQNPLRRAGKTARHLSPWRGLRPRGVQDPLATHRLVFRLFSRGRGLGIRP